MSGDTNTETTPATPGGMRTRHFVFGIGLPIQSVALAALQYFCHSGFVDNPITYTTIATTVIGIIDSIRNSGKN